MPLYPALTLTFGPLGACRKYAGHFHEWKEIRSLAGFRQIEPQLQILHQMTARQRRGADRAPRKHHSCPHQLNGAMKVSQSKRTNPVSENPGEFREAVIDGRIFIASHHEQRLYRPL